MKGLTKRQREVVDYIHEFIEANRYSPSYREIGTHFGFSSLGSVHKHISTLKKKGALSSEENTSRSLLPVQKTTHEPKTAELTIPLIGHITAGMPIQTFSESQQICVPPNYVHSPDKTYALRAKGDSLNEEMISDGDILLVEVRTHAHPGETVVALINGHNIIIKKYYPEGNFVRLLSSQNQHRPMLILQEDIAVQAVMVSLIRFYG